MKGFIEPIRTFEQFDWQHGLAILATALIVGLCITWANRSSEVTKDRIGQVMALTICIAVIIWTAIKLYLGVFDITKDLPLALCNASGLLVPFSPLVRITDYIKY